MPGSAVFADARGTMEEEDALFHRQSDFGLGPSRSACHGKWASIAPAGAARRTKLPVAEGVQLAGAAASVAFDLHVVARRITVGFHTGEPRGGVEGWCRSPGVKKPCQDVRAQVVGGRFAGARRLEQGGLRLRIKLIRGS